MEWYELDWTGSGLGPLESCCEYRNEHSGSIKCWDTLSWVAAQLMASQEGLSCMELVLRLCFHGINHLFHSYIPCRFHRQAHFARFLARIWRRSVNNCFLLTLDTSQFRLLLLLPRSRVLNLVVPTAFAIRISLRSRFCITDGQRNSVSSIGNSYCPEIIYWYGV
jgi:hypothetical protein